MCQCAGIPFPRIAPKNAEKISRAPFEQRLSAGETLFLLQHPFDEQTVAHGRIIDEYTRAFMRMPKSSVP